MTEQRCIFIASHNGRMKCILRDLIGSDKYNKLIKSHKKGFFNCSILRIFKKNRDNNVTLSLIYDGIINEDHQGGSPFKKKKEPKIPFTCNSFGEYTITVTEPNSLNNLLDEYSNIFIIRHGYSDHNQKKDERKRSVKNKLKYNLSIDTKLRHLGITQALNAGIFFKTFLDKENLSIDWDKSLFCSSILYRTAQTMALFLLAQGIDRKVIHMVNMNHEISSKAVKKESNCNAPYKEKKGEKMINIKEKENYTSLTQKKDGTFESNIKKYCVKHQFVFLTSENNLYRLLYNIKIPIAEEPQKSLLYVGQSNSSNKSKSKTQPNLFNNIHLLTPTPFNSTCTAENCKKPYKCALTQYLDFTKPPFNFILNETSNYYSINQKGGRLEYLLEKIINSKKEKEYYMKLSNFGLEEEYKELLEKIKE